MFLPVCLWKCRWPIFGFFLTLLRNEQNEVHSPSNGSVPVLLCPSLLQVAQQDWPMPTLPTLTTSPSLAVPTLPRTAPPSLTAPGAGLRVTEALYLLTGMLRLLTWTTSSAMAKLNKVLLKHTHHKNLTPLAVMFSVMFTINKRSYLNRLRLILGDHHIL